MTQFVRRSIPDGPSLSEHPIIDGLMRSRGVTAPEELDSHPKHLLSWRELKGIEDAVDLIVAAIEAQGKILIVSDYDCDGATGAAIAAEGLQMLGAEQVGYFVINRFRHGYGLSPAVVEDIAPQAPDLVITVDNGISSVEGAQRLKEVLPETRLLITDHHLPPETLPVADALVNPNQVGCPFPSKNLAGCGVMFYVLMGVNERLGKPARLSRLLDLVALGTVADVVPLDANNRRLVSAGLSVIRAEEGRPGIEQLLRVAGKDPRFAQALDFGFAVGPRLNAAGRIDDMSIGVRLLLTWDEMEAQQLAGDLDHLNRERKEIEATMRDEALLSLPEPEDLDRYGLCFHSADWHEGVVGLVASRVKERWFRPTICFADAADGETIKGSARGTPGVHLRDALQEIEVEHPGLILKYGGHAAAAGLSIKKEDFDRFAEAFDQVMRRHLTPQDIAGVIETDGELPAEFLTLDFAHLLEESGPWGQGFPVPIFDGTFHLNNYQVLGGRHLKLFVIDELGIEHEAISFFAVTPGREVEVPPVLRIAYQLDINRWKGRERLQLLIQYMGAEDEVEIAA